MTANFSKYAFEHVTEPDLVASRDMALTPSTPSLTLPIPPPP